MSASIMAMQSTRRDISPKDRSTAFLIFGFLLACYMLTFTGRIDSSDGLSTFATTESFVRYGGFDSNQVLWMGNQQGNIGPDGNLYSRKGLGMVLLAMPLLWLAKVWPSIGLVHAAMLLNPLLTAWTGALIFRAGRRLNWTRALSMTTALIFGLLTMAWPYAQSYFSDPVSGWGLFAAAYGLIAYSQSGRKHYLVGAGVAWSIAYLTRTINLMTLPIYTLGLLLVLRPAFTHLGTALPERLRRAFWCWWRPVVTFAIPVVAAGLLSLWWNWARYGSIWDTGYVETETFSADWVFGLFGLTVGPARGIIWYNPILLLAVPGAVWFWRYQRRILLLSIALISLYFVVYAKWYMWHGGYSWGPRFVVPMVPFLSLLAGPGWNALMSQRLLNWFGVLAGSVLAAGSLWVQWLGLLVPFALVQDRLATEVTPLFADVTFTDIRYSPLLLQWPAIRPETIHLAWWRGDVWPDGVDWLAFGMTLAGIAVGLLLLVQQVYSGRSDDREDRLRNGLYAAALMLITVALLTYYNRALEVPVVRTLADRIARDERTGDAVLLLHTDATQSFANAYRGVLPVYGHLAAGRLNAEQAAWLSRLEQRYDRLWVVPNGSLPEQSGWERALRVQDFLLSDDRLSGESNQRVALYALLPRAQMVESGLGTVFGDPAAPLPVTESSGWIRLKGYAITPVVERHTQLLLTLLWESLQPITTDYQVFVHLLDASGNKLAQRDGQPVQWMRPTSTWKPGEEIADRYGLLLPQDLAQGRYTLAVGLYDPVTGQRLPVSAGPASYAIELGPVEVR